MPPARLAPLLLCITLASYNLLLPSLGAQAPVADLQSAATRGADDTSIFAPLTLTPPTGFRLRTGAPGPAFWQNRADYVIDLTLDTTAHLLRGALTLRYTNHSPDSLPFILFGLYANNVDVTSVAQHLGDGRAPLRYVREGDVLKVTLAKPLPPGRTAVCDMAWEVRVGDNLLKRGTGFTRWYPQVNTYDDVQGWSTAPMWFTPEHGDYTVRLTVPARYVVAATGTLENARDVLTTAQLTRLARAAAADSTVHVITAADWQHGTARPQQGMQTWQFHATDVGGFAWALEPGYLWDATSWKGVLVQAYYPPSQDPKEDWSPAAEWARTAVRDYTGRWGPTPYPQLSVVAGGFGDTYPMISLVHYRVHHDECVHEVGHNWFGKLLHANSVLHGWMNEGFNTFANSFVSTVPGHPDVLVGDEDAGNVAHPTNIPLAVSVERALQHRPAGAADVDGRVEGADEVGSFALYYKPAFALQLLRQVVLGPTAFDSGFRTYVRRWAHKVPTPADFFRTMEDVSGRKLDWFWREWFFETPSFDQAVDSVAQTVRGTTARVVVRYANRARGVLPLLVRFTFTDGTVQDFTYPATVWRRGTTYTVVYAFGKRAVKQIVLDPEHHLVDVDRANNVWTAP